MNTHLIRVTDVTKERVFSLSPEPEARAEIAARLEASSVKKLTFAGEITPVGATDWRLTGRLGATVVQPCVVTLEPVTTRIDETVTRLYLAQFEEPQEGSEEEMPEDDSIEAAPGELDLALVMEEALALALPDWPRKDGIDAVDLSIAEPGVTPLSDADVKPFAALKSLKDRMGNTDGES